MKNLKKCVTTILATGMSVTMLGSGLLLTNNQADAATLEQAGPTMYGYKYKTPATKDIIKTPLYTVQKGDTLYSIGKRSGLTVDMLKSRNKLKNEKIKVGQVLTINEPIVKTNDGSVDLTSIYTKYYTVQSGDSLYRIAKRSGVSMEDIIKWNHLGKKPVIHPKQVLQVKP